VISFETIQDQVPDQGRLDIKLCRFKIARALEADDAGALIEDVRRPSINFSDVYGASEAKESLRFIVDWLINPKKFTALGLRPPKGVLMAGSPGTGKTMLARALAGESECAFLETSATSFITKWQGSGPQSIRDLFSRARRYAPSIVFIDEIDAIGIARSGGPNARAQEETLNVLLTEMDGFRGLAQGEAPVVVIAASNLVDQLDEALKRRFDRTIEIDKPDREIRLAYLQQQIANRHGAEVSAETLHRMAGQSAGMTIADLERVLQEAGVMAAQSQTKLSDDLLEEAFEKARIGTINSLPDARTLERVARHEAGHTLIAWHGGHIPVQVTIVGRGDAGGFMEREIDEKSILYTKPELEQRIREAMGGRASELLYYGAEEGLSSGVASDLKNATRWAMAMVQEFGMDTNIGQVALRDKTRNWSGDGLLSARIARQVKSIIEEQLQQACLLLQEHRTLLDSLVLELLEKNRLTGDQVNRILNPK